MSECRPERPSKECGSGDDGADPSVEAAVARIGERGESIRDRQVERALGELDDDLTARERAVVEALGDRLVERLLAVPEAQLKAAASEGDDEQFDCALKLFG